MSVRRFTLLVENPEPVFAWLAEHGGGHVVRQQASSAVGSVWLVKVALDNPGVADKFQACWEHATATMERHRSFLKQGSAL